MTRKVTFGYCYNEERIKKKGTIRSRIYFDMWKDKDPYYVIHRFLYENDPDNKNFNYDIDLATKEPCKRNIFKHYKKDNKLRFFWYASGLKKPHGVSSRYINYSLEYNEFRFSKLRSYYHILPYVHEHYKDDPRYIYFMNRFLSRHGRISLAKRESLNKGIEFKYKRDITWKDMIKLAKEQEIELYKKYGNPDNIKVNLGNNKYFIVKPDGFKVHGEYYSTINKNNRYSPYDIYHPYYRTKNSSKRRRFRERGIPLDPNERCKTRKERLIKNAAKKPPKHEIYKKYLKKKKSFKNINN